MRFVNRTRWKGETVICTVRLARPIVDFMDNAIDGDDLRNRSECLQEAAFFWCVQEEQRHA